MTKEYQRFLNSMNIDYFKWHDGVGYDLDALRKLSPDEQNKVENVLIERGVKDWRDIEALVEIGSEKALSAVKYALKSDNYEVRITATETLSKKNIITVVSPKIAIRTLKNRKSTFGVSPPEHTETQPNMKSIYRLAVGFS